MGSLEGSLNCKVFLGRKEELLLLQTLHAYGMQRHTRAGLLSYCLQTLIGHFGRFLDIPPGG